MLGIEHIDMCIHKIKLAHFSAFYNVGPSYNSPFSQIAQRL